MKPWTHQAKQRLEEYLEARARREGLEGADARELVDDLRAHVFEETEKREAEKIESPELEAVLEEMEGGRVAGVAPERSLRKSAMLWFFGGVLPLGVILLEAITGFCGGVFFDPLPSVWHGLLTLTVPLGIGWLLIGGGLARETTQGVVAGVMLAVSAFYALLFLPLVPASMLALIYLGMGLLSLAPVISFFAAWRVSRARQRRVARPWLYRRGKWWGVAAAVLALGLLEGPGIWTRMQLDRALEGGKSGEAAVARLRAVHSERSLLKACYEGNRGTEMATDIPGWLSEGWRLPMSIFGSGLVKTSDSEMVREVFFRVTGKPFNSMKPPRGSEGGIFGGNRRAMFDEWEFDDHLGGDDVAVRLKGLDLAESRFDGHLDATSAIGYGEWTMVFENRTGQPKEARCQVRLPRGGRVSRLTLWVNGEPREAAFNAVAKVKAAYQEVAVKQRRDPVLVTMAGPDTVMVQCFPVPAHGEMKIRFGVTASCDRGAWELPRIVERNFGLAEGVEHALWVQADREFTAPGLPPARRDGEGFSSQAAMEIGTVLGRPQAIELELSEELPGPVWCRDRFAKSEAAILCRKARAGREPAVDRLVVVIDGSVAMAEAAEWLRSVFPGKSTDVLLATDGVGEFEAGYRFTGGRDNEPALREAISRARDAENGAVVWLHGPQPVKLAEAEALRQLLERGTRRPEVYEVEVVPGPNRLVDELGKGGLLRRGPRLVDPARDLAAFLDELKEGRPTLEWAWERRGSIEGVEGPEVWDHLARLWAMERAGAGEADGPKVAAAYQLVTPVSGAVVLETMEQFERHGLKPVDAEAAPSIPTIPEPSTSLLLMLGTAVGLLRRRREMVEREPRR